MRTLACATLILLASACATAPRPVPRPHVFVPAPTSGPRILLARAPMDPTQPSSQIGRADLDEARALLSRARNDLEPRYWEPLDRKLTDAERAFERFSRAVRTSGQAAEVARGTEGLAHAGRARQAVGALSRVGPLLVALILLWPSSTAGPEDDSRPLWADAQRELELRLRDVSEASQQLMAELEAQPAPRKAVATETETEAQPAPSKGSPPALTPRSRPKCQPVPVPHLGGDITHDKCADVFPPNQFPGMDVLVNGKRFDALQAGVRVLWEIKTDRFDTYSPELRRIVVEKQVPELRRERDIAAACGYGFVVGVSSAAHKAALERQAPELNIVVTGCQ